MHWINTAPSEDKQKTAMLQRMTQVFGRVNSVLTLRHTNVVVEHRPELPAPAWSDAQTVTFNVAHIGDLTDMRDLAWLKGLDLHEVAHILYTPRIGSELCDWVKDNDYWQSFNALEDMRIETLLVGRYPSIIPWLQATIGRFFIDNPEAFQTSYAVLRGRKYLPVELRAESRKAWHRPEVLDELSSIIDAYRVLIFPSDAEDAKDLIARFDALMPKVDIETIDTETVPSNESGTGSGTGSGGCGVVKIKKTKVVSPHGHGGRPVEGLDSSSSRPASMKEQKRDLKSAKRFDGADEVDFIDDDIDVDDCIQPDDNDEADRKRNSNKTPEPIQTGDTDSNEGSGVSLGTATKTILENMVGSLFDDEKISHELENLVRQVQGLPTLEQVAGGKLRPADWKYLDVPAKSQMYSKQFAKELERIKSNAEPDWEMFESRGRMDVWRVERGDDFKTVFDRWSEDNSNAVDIECVIAVDISGSMGSHQEDAYTTMYILKRALDKIDASTSVVVFESYAKLLYAPKDKAGLQMRSAGIGGGTSPLSALQYATNTFATSKRNNKILFVVSDGMWSDTQNCDMLIKRMRNAGVLTAFAYIGYGNNESHECELVKNITNASQLIGLGKNLVRLSIARKLSNK